MPDYRLPRAETRRTTGITAPIALRILATSDLHAHLMPWDYLADTPAAQGLAQLAPLIRRARAESANCLLLDNGDFLQGDALADWHDATRRGPHPMIGAMNALGYDAGTLGNHEFSFGLPRLLDALAEARFPLVSANLARSDGAALAPAFVLLDRDLTDQAGHSHRLRIAITGFAPPQTTRWEALRLNGSLHADDMLTAARAVLARIKTEKPDLTIALAHTGIGAADPQPDMENAALPLAALPGIDLLVTGHTHLTFPTDTEGGTLSGKPAVMPGCFGSHLGQIDLTLHKGPAGWRIAAHRSALHPTPPRPAADPALARLAAPAHHAALDWMRQPLGQLAAPLHSHFALLGPSTAVHLVAEAQRQFWHTRLPPDLASLPLLSAVAPFRTGGRGGPQNVTDIPAGPIQRRHVTDLYTHPNTPVLLCLTGAELTDWLERAAILFHTIRPGQHDATLIRPEVPGFDFDLIHGLSFRIDLTQPPRFDTQGHLSDPSARRIRDLALAGKPVRPAARFLVASNSYRAGSAIFPGTARPPVARSDTPIRDIIATHIATLGTITPALGQPWGFAPVTGTTVTFDACPTARNHLPDIAHLNPEPLGPTGRGFLRFRLSL